MIGIARTCAGAAPRGLVVAALAARPTGLLLAARGGARPGRSTTSRSGPPAGSRPCCSRSRASRRSSSPELPGAARGADAAPARCSRGGRAAAARRAHLSPRRRWRRCGSSTTASGRAERVDRSLPRAPSRSRCRRRPGRLEARRTTASCCPTAFYSKSAALSLLPAGAALRRSLSGQELVPGAGADRRALVGAGVRPRRAPVAIAASRAQRIASSSSRRPFLAAYVAPQRRRLHVRPPLDSRSLPFSCSRSRAGWLPSIGRRVHARAAAPRSSRELALPYPVFGEGRWRIEASPTSRSSTRRRRSRRGAQQGQSGSAHCCARRRCARCSKAACACSPTTAACPTWWR